MSIFSNVPITKVSRSSFNLDHEAKLSFNFGGLYPILTQTVLPGDKMSLGVQSFVRAVPLLSPVMHRNDIKVDAFFVPMRLIWDNAEKWQKCSDETIKMPQIYFKNGEYVKDYQMKYMFGSGSLADYLGFASIPFAEFPQETSQGETYIDHTKVDLRKLNLLPFRCYQLIYDYYYRNKTLEDSIDGTEFVQAPANPASSYDIKSNNDIELFGNWSNSKYVDFLNIFNLQYRSWRRDMFTSALPSPQKGNPVLMPTGDIVSDGNFKLNISGSSSDSTNVGDTIVSAGGNIQRVGSPSTLGTDRFISYNKGLKIDSPTIEDLRYGEVLQEYEEALARAGAVTDGSFKEWLLAIWRTISPDARLDRPEYLGGYRGPITISEVPQTSEGSATSAQGTLAGKAISVGGQRLFRNHVFKEAGYLMVIMSVVPKSGYFQGDPRQFLYKNCYDWPNPYFANLGEQEVYSQEVAASSALFNSNQQATFGYQVRNYEMKQIPDSVHGALRDSLLYWHEARNFDIGPSGGTKVVNLNKNFVKMYPSEVSRIFPSIETSDKLIGEFFFNFKAKRSLPYYGVPRIGHTK